MKKPHFFGTKLFLKVFAVFMLSFPWVSSQAITTDQLLEACKVYQQVIVEKSRKPDPDLLSQSSYCLGYVSGVSDVLELNGVLKKNSKAIGYDKPVETCSKAEDGYNPKVKTVTEALQKSDSLMGQHSAMIAILLSEAYPCAK